MYIQIFNLFQKLFSKGGAGVYDTTNQALFREYRKCHCPDGQIVFLAANPAFQQKGIGSKLLEELEHREKGKQVYLYTDDACTYQFYERRGFQRSGEKKVVLDFGSKKVPLTCFLFYKTLGNTRNMKLKEV